MECRCVGLVLVLLVGPARGYTTPRYQGTSRPPPGMTPGPAGSVWPPSSWHKEEIPNPRLEPGKCGRGRKRTWVCDPNSILSTSQADAIDDEIEALRMSTGSCKCEKQKKCPRDEEYGGWQAGVAVISSMRTLPYQPSAGEKLEEAADYADHVRDDSWELGRCNDDLVIFVSWEDRMVYTAVGDDMTPYLTDYCVDVITKENKHYLSQNKLGQGIRGMIHDYSVALKGEHHCRKSNSLPGWAIAVILGGVLLVVVVVVVLQRRGVLGRCESSGGEGGYRSPSHSRGHGMSGGSRRDSVKSNESGGGGGGF